MADTTIESGNLSGENEIPPDMVNLVTILEICNDILERWSSTRIIENKRRDPFKVFLDKYWQLINESSEIPSFDDHKMYFQLPYARKRSDILHTLEDDNWMSKDLSIWFGENDPDLKKLNKKIMISAFFRKASEIRDELEIKLTEEERLENPDYYLADELLYFLLKCFRQSIEGTKYAEDANNLDAIIDQIGNDIGIKTDEPRKRSGGSGMLGGFMSAIGTMADNAGFKLPDGTPISKMINNIDPSKIGDALTDAIKNTDIMKNVGTALGSNTNGQNNGSTDMSSVLQGITSTLGKAASQMMVSGASSNGKEVDEETKKQMEEQAKKIEEGFSNMANMFMNTVSGAMPGTNVDNKNDTTDTTVETPQTEQ